MDCKISTNKDNDFPDKGDAHRPFLQKTQILPILKTLFQLEPQREQQGINKIIDIVQKFSSKETFLRWAASDVDALQEHMGMEFEKYNPIYLTHGYQGMLYYLNCENALFEILEQGQPCLKFHGKKVEFYVKEKQQTVKNLFTTIENSYAIINFIALGICIKDFSQIHVKIYIDKANFILSKIK